MILHDLPPVPVCRPLSCYSLLSLYSECRPYASSLGFGSSCVLWPGALSRISSFHDNFLFSRYTLIGHHPSTKESPDAPGKGDIPIARFQQHTGAYLCGRCHVRIYLLLHPPPSSTISRPQIPCLTHRLHPVVPGACSRRFNDCSFNGRMHEFMYVSKMSKRLRSDWSESQLP